MSRRPRLYLVEGGLAERKHGIYRLRKPEPAAAAAETWPRDGEWRRLIRKLTEGTRKED